MKETFYKDFGLTPVPKDYKNNQEVYNIYKKPTKDKKGETPRTYNFSDNDTHQMDVLYMPSDRGYKYCVVIADIGTHKTDAEPIKNVNSSTVLKAVQKIYNRGILEQPKKIITDSGKEFQGDFSKHYTNEEVNLKKALPGRHRQVGLVEKYNGILARVLFMRMASEELMTGKRSAKWVSDLKIVVDAMNKRYGHNTQTETQLLKKFNPYEQLKQNLIPIGTVVRVQLDEPKNITGEKLHGKFRATDHRWSLEKYKVIDWIFDPIEPVLYVIDKKLKPNEKVAYSKNQLQIVKESEERPPLELVKRNR
jgi:hypothetical protein